MKHQHGDDRRWVLFEEQAFSSVHWKQISVLIEKTQNKKINDER